MNKKIKKAIFVMLAVIIILAGMRSIWRLYYNQPLHRIELVIPETAGGKNSIEFSIPGGRYIIKAEIEGEPVNNDEPRIIQYKVTLPKQGFITGREAKIDFSYRAKEVWLESFKIKQQRVLGVFSVEMVSPGKSAVKAKIFIIKEVLFKTVE